MVYEWVTPIFELHEELCVYEMSNNMSLFADETLLINVVCGILSGVISSAIANPTDVLKVSSAMYIS